MADSRDDFIIAIRYALLKKGSKQKFSLFFLILLSISVISLDKLSVPFILSTRAVLNDIVYQISFVASTPGKFISFLTQVKKKHFDVVNENNILKKEIEILKKGRYNYSYIKTENKSLKEALNLTNKISDEAVFSVTARVLLDQESPYLKSLLANKGVKDGIKKGMTVFSKSYLIGIIIEANYITSRALLVTDLNSKIPVVIQDSGVNALLVGEGKKTSLTLEYLPDEFILEPNKIIYTSGKDGFLAPGLPVAITYLNKKKKLQIKSLSNPQQALIINITRGKSNK